MPRTDLTGEQRKHLYRSAHNIIDRFERDDRALDDRASASQPDGYPAGGDNPRSSDIADPTGSAVLGREHGANNRATAALTGAVTAIDQLLAADRQRAAALPPTKPDAVESDCISCIRINVHSPRDTSAHFAQPNPRCTFCAGFWREHKFDAPDWILEKRQQGKRIYDRDIARAVLEHRQTKRKKKRR